MKKIKFIFINCVIYFHLTLATSDNFLLKFESLYSRGVNAYLENNWASCVEHLELAIDDWLWWNKNILRCRKNCYDEANKAQLIFGNSELYEYDKVFEKILVNTLCLVKCKKNTFGSRVNDVPPSDVLEDFKKYKPYDYLQLCYYKQGQLDKAANAAATILANQPDHEIMQANIKYYVTKGGLDVKDIKNLDLGEHILKFMEGDENYQEGRYKEAIKIMEESLDLYWQALTECRMGCEDPFDHGWYPDFVSSVANHYTFTLRCKLKCPPKLSTIYGGETDFVASVLNYLQYSYFQVKELGKACEAVESYLMIYPNDSSQVKNKEFLNTQEGVKENLFTPRTSILNYVERKALEAKLMSFIEESFSAFTEDEFDSTPLPSAEETDGSNQLSSLTDALLEIAEIMGTGYGNHHLDKEEL